ELHDLDDADHRVRIDLVAHLNERRLPRFGRPVEGPEHRSPDGDLVLVQSFGAILRRCGRLRGRCPGDDGLARYGPGRFGPVERGSPADGDTKIALLEPELREVRLIQQLDDGGKLFEIYIHGLVTSTVCYRFVSPTLRSSSSWHNLSVRDS